MDSSVELEIIEKFRKATNRLVLLDYDGTLVNYASFPDKAILPDYIFDILFNLHDNPLTRIFIITGRRYKDIDKLLNHTSINIIAEHGAMIKENGVWKEMLYEVVPWKKKVVSQLNDFTILCPGSFVEEKNISVTWHYRNADPELGYAVSRKIIENLRDILAKYNLKILDGKKVLEILTHNTGKGLAIKKLFEEMSYDFVLSIGDDATDEEMFEFLLNFSNAVTIKVGEGNTYARYNFNSINEVVILLKLLLG
jgi:trehalose 6-phosphate synthase/phosphatase